MEHLLKILAAFTVELWYKMLILVGFILLVIGLVVPVQAIPNLAVVLIGAGVFAVGMGEWLNHPYRTMVYPNTRRTGTTRSRLNCRGGVVTVAAGIAVATFGVVVAVWHYLG